MNFYFDKVFSVNGNNIIFNSKLNYGFYLSIYIYTPNINNRIEEIYSLRKKFKWSFTTIISRK